MGDGASLFGLSLPFVVAWMVFGDFELDVDSQEGALCFYREPANGNAGLSRIQRNKLTPAHLTRAIQRSIRKKYKNFHSLPPCD